MKFALLALIAATAAVAQDKVYIAEQDLTCYKIMDGETEAHLDCKPGHVDDAPTARSIPPQAREAAGPADDFEERDLDNIQHLQARVGSCMFGLGACKLSCKNMGCGGGRCRTGRWGVCSCSC